ncbi:MAG: ABC transporter permease [Ruminococcus flavefaciens]|nr:ABC transporter permease [Ruminococcus flavefaciens]
MTYDNPSISTVTCRIESEEDFSMKLSELNSLNCKENDLINNILFQSDHSLICSDSSDKMSFQLIGAYGQPLMIRMIVNSFLSNEESLHNECNNIIIHYSAAQKLFGSAENAIGQSIVMIDMNDIQREFCIRGVYENTNSDENSSIAYISFAAFCATQGKTEPYLVSKFQVIPTDLTNITNTRLYVVSILRDRYPKLEQYSYKVMVADVVNNVNMVVNFVSVLLVFCSVVIFFVSGVSIRNMVISLMQTYVREIGIKKSIGASETVICIEYLMIGIIIALFGAFCGFLISFASIRIINENMTAICDFLVKSTQMMIFEGGTEKLYLSPFQLAVSLFFSVGVVILCCNQPIHKSASMKIVDALHS